MITIRPGKPADLPKVLSLIQELAVYEKAGDQVENTVARMEADGFGAHPVYGLFVADHAEHGVIGTAIYYYRYSTWKGKWLYLEDIVVTEKQRGQGIGKQLFDQTIKIGLDTHCTGMMWQVLDWNAPAIGFYEKYYQPRMESEWLNCKLSAQQMQAALNPSTEDSHEQ